MTSSLLLAAGLLLLVSGVAHVRSSGRLALAVRAHGVLPGSLSGPAAMVLPVAELLGAGVSVWVATQWLRRQSGQPLAWPTTVGAVAVAALFAAFAAYALRAWRIARASGTTVPCACGLGDAELGGWAVARAALISLGVLVAALATGGPRPANPGQVIIVLAAAAALAGVLAILPTARSARLIEAVATR